MASSLASGPTAPLGPCSALRSQLRSSVVARSVAAPPRPTQQRQAAVAHPELLSPTSSQRGFNFDEYIQHTQMMDRLADRQSELANVLVQLTELDEQLPDLDPPSPTPDDKSEVEVRRAKRAAQRAERKAAMQAAAAGAASTSHSTSATPFLTSASHHAESLVHADASSSSSSGSSAWAAAHAPSRSGMEPAGSHARASSPAPTQQADVLQLEELFKLTMDDDQEPPQQQPQQPTLSRRLAPASNPHAATSRSSFAAPASPSTSSASAGGVLVPRKTARRRATVTAPAPAAAPAVEPTAASTAAAPALPTILRPASSRTTTSPPEPALKQSQHSTPSPPEDGLFDILQIVSTPPASASAALAPAPQAASPQTLTPRRRRATSEPVPQPRQELQPASQQQEQQQEPPQPQQRVSRSSTATVVVEEDEEEQEFAGPSEEDLAALERALAASSDEENEDEAERNPRASSSTSSSLEASALVGRHQEPGQLGVGQLLAGPSLLSLVPAHAAPGRGARARQVRRKSRQGHAAAVAVAAPTRGSKSGSGSYGRGDSTSVFLATSSNHAFLDTDIEKEVTEMTRDLLFLDKVKKQCAKTLQRPPTTQEVAMALGMDEHSYQARYAAGLKAKEMLLKSNYRLVMAVCKKYIGNAGNGLQMQDLVSEGVKGLLRSVEKYDASKGFRFGTYAHWWIRQAVSRSLQETGRAVRLPVHMIEQITKMRAASQAISMRLGREATTAELAEALELPPSRIDALIAASRAASSLDTPVMGNDSGATAKDVVEDDSADADEEFGLSSLKHDIEDMIGELPEREATVVRLRFGLEDGEEWTLEDIGERLGVTRERIRQIEAKALQRLKVRTVESSGKLREYSDNLDMMESREVAARTSSGTKKT